MEKGPFWVMVTSVDRGYRFLYSLFICNLFPISIVLPPPRGIKISCKVTEITINPQLKTVKSIELFFIFLFLLAKTNLIF